MDVFTPEKRSEVMSRIRSKGAKSTEELLRQLMVEAGLPAWVENDKALSGKPDFAFHEQRVAVFVDGCFWHGCPHCYDGHIPKSNAQYWSSKIEGNMRRDRRAATKLRRNGWAVVRVWECRIHSNPGRELNRVLKVLEKRVEGSPF